MVSVKQLTPDEYSKDKKKALEEVYGVPWEELRKILIKLEEKKMKKQTKINRIRKAYNEKLTPKEAYRKFRGEINLGYIKIAYVDIKAGRTTN